MCEPTTVPRDGLGREKRPAPLLGLADELLSSQSAQCLRDEDRAIQRGPTGTGKQACVTTA